MKKNRIILFLSLFMTFGAILLYMNLRYDELARNTSINRNNRDLVVEKLDKDQIRYIVENNIDVNEFYEFLDDVLFNFDNYRGYRKAMDTRLEDTHTVVAFVNATTDLMDQDDLYTALKYYDYATLRKLIVDHSPYNINASIVINPLDLSTYLDLNKTIGTFEPLDLVKLSDYEAINASDDLMLRAESAKALNEMCSYLKENLKSKCGNFKVNAAYLSYTDTLNNYTNAINIYGPSMAYDMYSWPSHNEHQLGLSIDLDYLGNDFVDYSENFMLLKQVASGYGFIFYDIGNTNFKHLSNNDHLRYVGKETATKCEQENICIWGETNE